LTELSWKEAWYRTCVMFIALSGLVLGLTLGVRHAFEPVS